MKSTACSRAILFLVLFTGGCIVGDELTTFTIHPDGSADLVVFRSNLRSTEKGEKGEKELADYRTRFATRTDNDFARIRDAGGKIEEAAWIRERSPFSNFVHAQFPNAATLEKFWTVKDEANNPLITTQFQINGSRRRLTTFITVPPEKDNSSSSPSDVSQLRQAYANGISETRLAVANGLITTARGFSVAEDRQSALLNGREISELIRLGKGKAELVLEWEVTH